MLYPPLNDKSFEDFDRDGFVLLKNIFTAAEAAALQLYTQLLIELNLKRATSSAVRGFRPEKYHELIDVDHNMVASSTYRYFIPPRDICDIIEKHSLNDFLCKISCSEKLQRWQDPGYGWLGYRIVRPNCNDGYPPSCKNWGAASGVFSLWLPMFGCTKSSTIRFLPASHKNSYNTYLPENSHFTQGELRLADNIPIEAYVRPQCNPGDALVYHPRTIHSEDSFDNEFTRVNLEYRYMPTSDVG